MRRPHLLLGALTIAATLASFLPSAAQNTECCSYSVTHHFRVCLPQGCQPQVLWKWQTQAAAWLGSSPVINQNNGTAVYGIPSADAKCASAVFGNQDCAFSSACASFNVDWIPGTNCVQGQHSAYGRACVRCRRHGANAQSNSSIVIACRLFRPPFNILWAPQFSDQVGGGCDVQIYDPVYLRTRRPDGLRELVLFELTASGVNWDAQDTNGDGFPDVARIRAGRRPPEGHITLLRRTVDVQVSESRLHLRFMNGVVTESQATGDFANLRWPPVGAPMPGPDDPGIPVPAVHDLQVRSLPTDWEVEEIVMGGGGEAGEPLPGIEGDVDGNGCVDDADLLQVLFAFGGQGGNADVNNDGVVDDADLLIVLFNFGQGC